MPLYLLDTDHVSLLLGGHEALARRLAAPPPESLRVSLITAQELLGGWLPQLKRPQPADRLVWAYEGFRRALAFLCDAHLLDFDERAAEVFQRLRGQYRRLGTNDLRIAAVALTAGATVVTRNARHFGQIKGLSIENWAG